MLYNLRICQIENPNNAGRKKKKMKKKKKHDRKNKTKKQNAHNVRKVILYFSFMEISAKAVTWGRGCGRRAKE